MPFSHYMQEVMQQLTFGSLFAGIGGFDLGFERAGMKCLWQVERNPFSLKVLDEHWPDVKKYHDVKECGKHNLERVDLICGGFPCQDISHLGKREGITGERSGLWKEFHRIICELRPRFVVVENVAALLVRGLSTVLGDLAEIGYDAEWEMLPAYAFNLPHRRERIFIIAYPSGSGTWVGRNWQCPQVEKVDWKGFLFLGGSGEDNGVSREVDRNVALGNAIVPAIAEFIGAHIQRASNNQMNGDLKPRGVVGRCF